jgi:DNA-binding winged helix-turn-helix (wHTH) protein
MARIGPFTLDSRTLLLMREDEVVKLPMKTVEVLKVLVDHRGDIVTKDELLKAAWPDSIVEEANLTVHVALLRKTLGSAAPIETFPKRGYRLVAESPALPSEPPEERRAREAVLRGRYFWNKMTRAALDRAEAAFTDALGSNASAGEARSGLSDTLLMRGLFGFENDRAVFERARLQAEQAVAASPDSADAQASFAFSQLFDRWDFEAARGALARARASAPQRVEPHLWTGLFHTLRGEVVRALAAAASATALDPISIKAVVGAGLHLYLAQQAEPDLDPLLKALDLEPESVVAHWALGLACDRQGSFDRAQDAHRAAIQHAGGSPTIEANLARSLALSGKRTEAAALRERLGSEGLAPYRLATIDIALRENARALEMMERALAVRDPWLVVIKVDPMLDPIRGDRRIKAIEKEVLNV